jgi:PleD family two-component response regulator
MSKQLNNKRVLAVVNDLFFTAKINEAAKRAGVVVDYATNGQDVIDKATAQLPTLIIFDLNFDAADPLNLIGRLKKNSELKQISLIGYLSHVQVDLKVKAQESGCDMVMPRSAFSMNLPQILKRHAGTSA